MRRGHIRSPLYSRFRATKCELKINTLLPVACLCAPVGADIRRLMAESCSETCRVLIVVQLLSTLQISASQGPVDCEVQAKCSVPAKSSNAETQVLANGF